MAFHQKIMITISNFLHLSSFLLFFYHNFYWQFLFYFYMSFICQFSITDFWQNNIFYCKKRCYFIKNQYFTYFWSFWRSYDEKKIVTLSVMNFSPIRNKYHTNEKKRVTTTKWENSQLRCIEKSWSQSVIFQIYRHFLYSFIITFIFNFYFIFIWQFSITNFWQNNSFLW